MADAGDEFRRQARVIFRIVVTTLVLIAITLPAAGWWLGHGWGLAGGLVLGGAVLIVGLTGAGLIYAFTQDGA